MLFPSYELRRLVVAGVVSQEIEAARSIGEAKEDKAKETSKVKEAKDCMVELEV